nr:MAG TPA: hypothetical protein [Caudoviricetes sp.]
MATDRTILGRLKRKKVFKNWKELCQTLEWIPKGGDSRKAQEKQLNRYCSWHKEGNKIIIDNVYNKPQVIVDERRPPYHNELQTGILLLLNQYQNTNGIIYLTKTSLLRSLGLTNANYNWCKEHQLNYANYLGVPSNVVNDFYQNYDSMVVNNVESALKQLEKRKLLSWSPQVMIVRVISNYDLGVGKKIIFNKVEDEMGNITESPKTNERIVTTEPIPATDLEVQVIDSCQRRILKEEMGFDDMQQMMRSGKADDFYMRSNELIREQEGMEDFYYCFKAYKLIFTGKNVEKALKDEGLTGKFKELQMFSQIVSQINQMVQDHSLDKAKGRKTGGKYSYREEEDFVDLYKATQEKVVDINEDSIISIIIAMEKGKKVLKIPKRN